MKRTPFLLLPLAAILSGCTPDSLTVTIPVSAVESARGGSSGQATARIVYSTIDDDDAGQLSRVCDIVRPFLGPGGEVKSESDEISGKVTASLKIPVVPESRLRSCGAVLAVVLRENGRLEVAEGPRMPALKAELKDFNSSFGISLDGGKQIFRLVGDSDAVLRTTVHGVFVDDRPVAVETIRVGRGDWTSIRFDRSDGSVYGEIVPFLELNVSSPERKPAPPPAAAPVPAPAPAPVHATIVEQVPVVPPPAPAVVPSSPFSPEPSPVSAGLEIDGFRLGMSEADAKRLAGRWFGPGVPWSGWKLEDSGGPYRIFFVGRDAGANATDERNHFWIRVLKRTGRVDRIGFGAMPVRRIVGGGGPVPLEGIGRLFFSRIGLVPEEDFRGRLKAASTGGDFIEFDPATGSVFWSFLPGSTPPDLTP